MTHNSVPKLVDMNRGILAALKADADYSEAFTRRVLQLAHALGDDLATPVDHDGDMNYSSAQKIVVGLNAACQPVASGSEEIAYQLHVCGSAKGRYFAFVVLQLSASEDGWREHGLERPGRYWTVLDGDAVPAGIRLLQRRIAAILKAKGYTLLEGSLLSRIAEGHLTQMDERPATVFEVLFGELY
jgi:hypothetical protein